MNDSTWTAIVGHTERWREALSLPSLALVMVGSDEDERMHSAGLADLATGAAFGPDTLFPVGSLSKGFTAVLAAMLVREGRLRWDHLVLQHLPELRLSEPSVGMGLTVGDLFSHRSGLSNCDLLISSPVASSQDIIGRFSEAELAHTSGGFLYSNANYFLAGELLARVTGQPWPELLRQRILKPLGMSSTTASSTEFLRAADRARGYWQPKGEGGSVAEAPFQPFDSAAAAGGIHTTLRDLARWLRFLLDPKGASSNRRLLDPEDLRQLWSPQVPVSPGVHYGRGFKSGAHRGFQMIFHEGNLPGYTASLCLLPAAGAAFALLQGAHESPLAERIYRSLWDLWLPEAPQPTPLTDTFPGQAQEDDLRHAPLHFRSPDSGMSMTIYAQGKRLFLDVPGQAPIRLEGPSQSGVYFSERDRSLGPTLLRKAPGEEPQGMVLLHILNFNGLRLPPGNRQSSKLEGATLMEHPWLTGRYHIHHIEKEVEVRQQGDSLVVDIPGDAVYALKDPLNLGRWLIEPSQLQSLEFHGQKEMPARALTWKVVQPVEMARAQPEAGAASASDLLALRREARDPTGGGWSGCLELHGKVSYPNQGLAGELREWRQGLGHLRSEEDLSGFGSLLHLRLGTRIWSWNQRQGQALRELSGEELEASAEAIRFEAALAGEQESAQSILHLQVLGNEEIDGYPCLRVWVQPRVGLPMTCWIDEDTGVLHRRIRGLETTHYANFREVQGLQIPFSQTTEIAAPIAGRRIVELSSARLLDQVPPNIFSEPA